MKNLKLLMGLAGLSMLSVAACSDGTDSGGSSSGDQNNGGNNNGGWEEPHNGNGNDNGNGNGQGNGQGDNCSVVHPTVYITRTYQNENGNHVKDTMEVSHGIKCITGDEHQDRYVIVPTKSGEVKVHESLDMANSCKAKSYPHEVKPYSEIEGTLYTSVSLPAREGCE